MSTPLSSAKDHTVIKATVLILLVYVPTLCIQIAPSFLHSPKNTLRILTNGAETIARRRRKH